MNFVKAGTKLNSEGSGKYTSVWAAVTSKKGSYWHRSIAKMGAENIKNHLSAVVLILLPVRISQ
jgi:hypothetical protein